MAPLARQGLCALLAVGVVNAAGALAGTSTEHPESVQSSGSQADNRSGAADQVRAGLRGTLDSLKNRASGSDNADSSALSEALSEAATIELAAVALSSINTFWMSLTPAARSELLQELGSNTDLTTEGEIVVVPAAEEDEEDKDDSDGETQAAAPSPGNPRGSNVRQLRENREDSALFRVLQRLDSSSSQVSSTTSTSTLKPTSSTTISVSGGSSTIEIEAGDAGEDISEFEFGDDEAQRRFEDESLDKIHQQLAEIELNEADILLAFRAFIRRYSRFLGSYKERLIAFVDSDEFSSEVAKLKGAIRDHDKKHGIKKLQHDDHINRDERFPGRDERFPGRDERFPGRDERFPGRNERFPSRDEKHFHSSTTSTSTVAIEGAHTTMVAIGASTTTTTLAPEDLSGDTTAQAEDIISVH
ncbi:hypothetical protein Esti_005548 [Eimeria stiedai]